MSLKKKIYLILQKYCKKLNIDFLTTPFDVESLKWIKNLVPAIKIASADINNIPLLKEIGYLKKPVLLSTGASSIKEIKFAVNLLKKCGSKKIVIMHCILNYPTLDINANLSMINDLKKIFPKNLIGYSDHTLPSNIMSPCAVAYMFGARVVEKHFTFNKKKTGNDHYHSSDYNDALIMKKQIDKIFALSGSNKKKKIINSEKKSRLYARRSIVSNIDIKKNEIFTEKNLITKRPGTGISPLFWNKIIGKRSKRNIKADTQIQTKDF
jgi:sialic acid synthase SpsE